MRRYTLTIGGRQFVVDVQELTAERFEVYVDQTRYEVELADEEDLGSAVITPAMRPAVAGAPPPPAAAAPVARPAAPAASAGGALVSAPMPGLIVAVEVGVGEPVQRGQALVVLEAMKMNNPVRAPRDAVVAELLVSPGQQVAFGDALVRFVE